MNEYSANTVCMVFELLMVDYSHILSCCVSGIQWENECSYETATVAQFQDWLQDRCQHNNPLRAYECSKHWCYADYKYMAKLFATKPDILKVFFVHRRMSQDVGILSF